MQLISSLNPGWVYGYFQILSLFLCRSFGCATDAGNRNTFAIRSSRPHDPDVLSGEFLQIGQLLIFDGKDLAAGNKHVLCSALDASHGTPAVVASHFMMDAAIGVTDVTVVGVLCMLTAMFGCSLCNRRQRQCQGKRKSKEHRDHFVHFYTLLNLMGQPDP